jgi:competence protein ComEC
MWRIGIAFLIGLCCVHALSSLPSLWPGGLLLALAVGAAIGLRSYCLLAMLLGVGWAWGHAQLRLDRDLPAELEGRDLIVTGHIASMLDVRDLDPQFDIDVEHASDERVSPRLRLAWYDADMRPQPGELWRFVVRLKRRNGFANPGGFDYEGYLFRAGIGATGYVRQDDRNQKLSDSGLRYGVLRARAWIGRRIALAVGESPLLGVLQGLAVGDTQAMTPEQWRVFAATGTSHLMAISGLHISMIATLAALAGGNIVRWRGAQRTRITAIHGQALAGSVAALAYSLLAGMSVPTQRTLVMLCIFFSVRWWRRELSMSNAMGLALLGVLIADPFAPLSVGAWLSFGAVAVILLATMGRIARDGTVVNFARVQWAITLGLLPVLILAFGSQSLVSPIANAIAVPAFTLLIVPLVLCGSLLASLWLPAGAAMLGVATQLLGWCWPLMSWLAEQPWSMWYFAEMPMPYHALLALAALLLVSPSAWPTRCAAALLCMPILFFQPRAPAPGEYELAVLDVGQGLAIVVRTHGHALVYDTGPAFRTGRDTGELVVVPYLRARGIRSLDGLIVSHGDLDHEGGMRSVIRSIPTRSLLLGPSVEDVSFGAKRCKAGQRWLWDDVVFEVLHPSAGRSAASDNDTSCVLRISGKSGSVLLTGDIEEDAESQLVARGLPRTDVVVVAHHGSRSSSIEAFVAATRPQLAITSAGYRNRWGFPKPAITARWRATGASVLSTIETGALEVAMRQQGGVVVREYRRERRSYWSAR